MASLACDKAGMTCCLEINHNPFVLMQALFALFEITRPLNVAIAGISIWVAAALIEPFDFTFAVACAMISGMLIAAGANVVNDLCDLDIDRINRPQRVLPSERLMPAAALTFTIFLLACGNFFSIFINKAALTIAVGSSILLVVYSLWLKRQPLTGNLAISAATALAFIYGAVAAQAGLSRADAADGILGMSSMNDVVTLARSWHRDWRAGIFPAVFSFLFHFGREVIKDIEDQAGDQAMRARTLPLVYGLGAAQAAATVAFVILILATLLPFYLGIYNTTYLWIVIGGVDLVLGASIYVLWKNPAPPRMRQLSAVLKADMLVGLAAIYLGR
jgi:geranylgeranylglycerol-phosphate geranylgeranyltransferase